jgi:hypothetical protein
MHLALMASLASVYLIQLGHFVALGMSVRCPLLPPEAKHSIRAPKGGACAGTFHSRFH